MTKNYLLKSTMDGDVYLVYNVDESFEFDEFIHQDNAREYVEKHNGKLYWNEQDSGSIIKVILDNHLDNIIVIQERF